MSSQSDASMLCSSAPPGVLCSNCLKVSHFGIRGGLRTGVLATVRTIGAVDNEVNAQLPISIGIFHALNRFGCCVYYAFTNDFPCLLVSSNVLAPAHSLKQLIEGNRSGASISYG